MSTKPIDAQETPATEELPAKRKSAPKKSKPLLQCAPRQSTGELWGGPCKRSIQPQERFPRRGERSCP